jgi:RNA polymerase sigma factor (sigma-70 family)
MQTTSHPVMASDVRQLLLNHREKTLEKIYARAYPMVLHYVKQHLGTAEDAKDLLQEAIIHFYEKMVQDQLTLTASPTTYLMAVCKNRWRRELEQRNRQKGLSSVISDQAKEEERTEPEAPALAITSYVEQLGEKCRNILVAFYYLGQRMEQIAQQHHYRNARTATVQKFKCLERLRNALASLTIHHFR